MDELFFAIALFTAHGWTYAARPGDAQPWRFDPTLPDRTAFELDAQGIPLEQAAAWMRLVVGLDRYQTLHRRRPSGELEPIPYAVRFDATESYQQSFLCPVEFTPDPPSIGPLRIKIEMLYTWAKGRGYI